MKRGQTIVAERERVESESERLLARKKVRRKHFCAVLAGVLMLAILVILGYLGVKQLVDGAEATIKDEPAYQIQAEIVDEDNTGQISSRVKAYIAQLEQDFQELGYKVKRVTLPTGTSRELYVDLEGVEMYFKVTIDRDAAVTAEDAERMIRYLAERDIHPTYVDVRIDGKAYYK